MHPYDDLPSRAFWRTAVASAAPDGLCDLVRPKRRLTKTDRIATAGSCFAQHIARALRRSGFNFLDAEPPAPLVPEAIHRAFNFGIYSARYGNIYTAAQLRQLVQRAFEKREDSSEIWQSGQRFYDPFRPTIEPNGYYSAEEVLADRRSHLGQVRWMFRNSDVFVYTMGLTEAWRNRANGYVYPICPGVRDIGSFNPAQHEFVNFNFAETYNDLMSTLVLLKEVNENLRVVLTVSPVPLTATGSDAHVLVATMESKSILRAVAGQIARERDDVEYFPSYEIVASPAMKGEAYADNLRDITSAAVERVLKVFLNEFCDPSELEAIPPEQPSNDLDAYDVICDERILEQYRK